MKIVVRGREKDLFHWEWMCLCEYHSGQTYTLTPLMTSGGDGETDQLRRKRVFDLSGARGLWSVCPHWEAHRVRPAGVAALLSPQRNSEGAHPLPQALVFRHLGLGQPSPPQLFLVTPCLSWRLKVSLLTTPIRIFYCSVSTACISPEHSWFIPEASDSGG